jgi:hypothetical protein
VEPARTYTIYQIAPLPAHHDYDTNDVKLCIQKLPQPTSLPFYTKTFRCTSNQDRKINMMYVQDYEALTCNMETSTTHAIYEAHSSRRGA